MSTFQHIVPVLLVVSAPYPEKTPIYSYL